MSLASFVHRYAPGRDQDGPVLLLLHGTGGNEEDLLPLGSRLIPGAALLSLRGRVLENGMPRFFRRFGEGRFDLEDLRIQTDALAAFLDGARVEYNLQRSRFIAVGYSNGANIAASLLLRHPHQLAAAVLFRAMLPFEPDGAVDLDGVAVFLAAGTHDPIVPGANTRALGKLLETNGAQVDQYWHAGGHELAGDDIDAARKWLVTTKLTEPTGTKPA